MKHSMMGSHSSQLMTRIVSRKYSTENNPLFFVSRKNFSAKKKHKIKEMLHHSFPAGIFKQEEKVEI